MRQPSGSHRLRRSRSVVLAGAVALTAVWAGAADATIISPWATTGLRPLGITMDAAGNVYTANYFDDTVTKVSPAGVTTIAWANVGDGPYGITVDSAGNLYTADADSDRIDKIAPDGTVTLNWAYLPAGSEPHAIVIDPDGNAYTANSANATVSKIAPDGTVTGVFGVTGSDPESIVLDAAGNVYTANYNDDTVSRITAGGVSDPAWATLTANAGPEGITIDSLGNLYTAGYNYGAINKITPDGVVSTVATLLTEPWGITIDSSGNLYTVDNYDPGSSTNSGASKIAPDGTVTGLGEVGHGAQPVILDGSGNLFMSYENNDPSDNNGITKIIPGGGTPDIAPAAPARPAAPRAAAGSESATITITPNAPSALFGAPSSYIVRSVEDPSKNCTITVPATSCTITGLTPGTSYRFTVSAALNTWTTSASDPSGSVTPTAVPEPAPAPAPAPAPVATFATNGARVPRAVAGGGLAVSSTGTVTLPLSCPVASYGGCDAAGDLSVTLPSSVGALEYWQMSRVKTLARFSGVEISAGRSRLVTLRLAPSVVERLEAAGIRRIPASLRTTTRLASGDVVAGRQRVWLRIPLKNVPLPVTG